ncbi:hypothetical protein AVEN_62445-1 [Araneus ventricosus]|uniref:TIL domain-containing protein n=1 Tax=Araneus ventricosus TaxID=182803 RepID=A0A4Y2VR89_ARAVE|nr:hypothetical protein AVEN_62445-1 [Araneus ventricosus]
MFLAGTASCPVNERYSDCVVPCNDCHTRGDCKFLFCNKGCDCQEGYFRNSDGKCIPATECASKNEVISTHMGGCNEARCVAFCKGYGLRGSCKEAYPGGEKLCLCTK